MGVGRVPSDKQSLPIFSQTLLSVKADKLLWKKGKKWQGNMLEPKSKDGTLISQESSLWILLYTLGKRTKQPFNKLPVTKNFSFFVKFIPVTYLFCHCQVCNSDPLHLFCSSLHPLEGYFNSVILWMQKEPKDSFCLFTFQVSK